MFRSATRTPDGAARMRKLRKVRAKEGLVEFRSGWITPEQAALLAALLRRLRKLEGR